MSTKSFDSAFRKSQYILQRAVNREVDLEYDYPKIYKKVKKYYQANGVQFYDDQEADYELIIELIAEDLKLSITA